MRHKFMKKGFLLAIALTLLMLSAVTASAIQNIAVERTISPTTVAPGESFDVSLKIDFTGTVEGDNSTMGVVKDVYTSVDDWENWFFSNVDAQTPFSRVADPNSADGMLECGTGAIGLAASSEGTYYVNYTVTTSADTAQGTYSISGYYVDPVYTMSGEAGGYAYATGDSEITIESGTVYLYPSMTFDEIQAAFDDAVDGSTIYFTDGYYDISVSSDQGYGYGIGYGICLYEDKSLTLTASSAENVTVYSGVNVSMNFIGAEYDDNTWEYTFPAELGSMVIENITFEASGDVGNTFGHIIIGYYDLTVRNCVFENCGITTSNPRTEFVDNSVFCDLPSSDECDLVQIDSYIDEGVISGNTFEGTTVYIGNNCMYWNAYPESGYDDTSEFSITDNIFMNTSQGPAITLYDDMVDSEFTDNIVSNNAVGIELDDGGDNCVITGNTFESNDAAFSLEDVGSGCMIYLNNFIDNTELNGASSTPSVQWVSDSALDYTYKGNSLSSILGNYYSDYAGNDSSVPEDGIGDTALVHSTGTDSYPLMGEWSGDSITSDITVLYQGTVELGPDMTCTFVPYNNAGTEYDIAPLSAMAALMSTGLDIEVSDANYADHDSFSLDNIMDIEAPTETCYWAFYVNGGYTSYGIGHATDDVVTDGDVVSFILTDYMSNEEYYMISITVDVTDRDDFLYYGAVDLVDGSVYQLVPYNNPSASYEIPSLSALGALIGTGFAADLSDANYADYSSFTLDTIGDIEAPTETCYWAFYVNGGYTSYGVGHVTDDVVVDGDVVSFILTDWNSYDEYDAVYIHVNEVTSYPVDAVRTIANQNFYEELLQEFNITSTKVTINLTATTTLDSLALEETVPEGWTITPSINDGAVFKGKPYRSNSCRMGLD